MKNYFLWVAAVFLSLAAYSQPQLPRGYKPGQKPAPQNLRPLRPADLSITEIRYLSASEHGSPWDEYRLRFSITVRNNGQLITSATKILGEYKSQAPHSIWMTQMPVDAIALPAISPGQSVTVMVVFHVQKSVFEKYPVDFRFEADGTRQVTESNETNNYSRTMTIDRYAL